MGTDTARIETEVRALVDDYRARCLWFLRSDFYPEDTSATLRVLDHIERHGDRDGFVRAGRIRQWLSRDSSAKSATS